VQDMLLIRLLLEDQDHSDIFALIITGKGKVFCSGADFSEILSITGMTEKGNKFRSNDMSKLCDTIQNFPKPTICALNGNAYGGGVEIACACDFRISKPDLEIVLPPAKLGIHYHLNGIKRFLSVFGLKMTKEILLLSMKKSEKDLTESGFLNHVIKGKETVLDAAKAYANQFKRLSTKAVSGMKLTINDIEMSSVNKNVISERIRSSLDSSDFEEGLKAIKEKRSPKFKL
jgi:enoyl-CoA hydratase/carnithine racemase